MTESAVNPKQILEALLFAADEPLSARRIAGMIDEATPGSIADLVRDLNADYLREDRAFHVQEIAGGYRLVTRPEFASWIGDLRASDSSPRLSQAALETLSIVAYKQPVTRAELESIRGVTVDGVLKTLVDRELVRITGREEGMGRPLLYGTTDHFLEYFGLPSLDALPRPDELEILFADRERQEELPLDDGPDVPGPGDDGDEE
ncbi:MAG TPA: SMC-Scp complex subunit ScpB [Gemmatimonadota bacterium]|nr:SMC-Scp complex subunit ScpB [Gemmatimonadota bacterium]